MRILSAPALLAALALSTSASAGFINPQGDTKQCIPISHIRAYSAEGEQSLLIHGEGSRVYRSKLPEPCDHLGRINDLAKLKIERHGLRLCAGDTFHVQDAGGILGGGGDSTTRCTLGRFESMTEMSITEELRR